MRCTIQNNLLTIFCILLVMPVIMLSAARHFFAVAGPFRIAIRKFEDCTTSNTAKEKLEYNLGDAVMEDGEIKSISANVTMPFTLSDKIHGHLSLASWSHGFSNMGSWKENSHVFNFKELCKAVTFMSPDLWTRMRLSAMGYPFECPFPPGIYRYQNISGIGKVAFKHFVYGKWRADATLLSAEGDLIKCMRIFADTVPV